MKKYLSLLILFACVSCKEDKAEPVRSFRMGFVPFPYDVTLPAVEETECDGIELNFGCPHGMSERGMGSAVGQVPEYIEMVVRWCKQYSRMPVITKLTPNITDIRKPARAAKAKKPRLSA